MTYLHSVTKFPNLLFCLQNFRIPCNLCATTQWLHQSPCLQPLNWILFNGRKEGLLKLLHGVKKWGKEWKTTKQRKPLSPWLISFYMLEPFQPHFLPSNHLTNTDRFFSFSTTSLQLLKQPWQNSNKIIFQNPSKIVPKFNQNSYNNFYCTRDNLVLLIYEKKGIVLGFSWRWID